MLDERGNMDPGKFKPVGKMIGLLWTKVNEVYSMERPEWGKHREELVRSVSEVPPPSEKRITSSPFRFLYVYQLAIRRVTLHWLPITSTTLQCTTMCDHTVPDHFCPPC